LPSPSLPPSLRPSFPPALPPSLLFLPDQQVTPDHAPQPAEYGDDELEEGREAGREVRKGKGRGVRIRRIGEMMPHRRTRNDISLQ